MQKSIAYFLPRFLYLCHLLCDWFLTTKRYPSNAQFRYIPNSSSFQATVYPVGVSKVWSLYTWVNVWFYVKLCRVITKICTRICLYIPNQCTKFQQDQSTHLQVKADLVICVKSQKNPKFGLSHFGAIYFNFGIQLPLIGTANLMTFRLKVMDLWMRENCTFLFLLIYSCAPRVS